MDFKTEHEKGLEAGARSLSAQLDKHFGWPEGTMWDAPCAEGFEGLSNENAVKEFDEALQAYLKASGSTIVKV